MLLRVLVAAHGIVTAARLVAPRRLLVAACMWDLVPRPGIEPGPLHWKQWSLTHWTTREVPGSFRSFAVTKNVTIKTCSISSFVSFSLFSPSCIPIRGILPIIVVPQSLHILVCFFFSSLCSPCFLVFKVSIDTSSSSEILSSAGSSLLISSLQFYDCFFFFLTLGLFIYLFIYGCVGSSFLCEGFL